MKLRNQNLVIHGVGQQTHAWRGAPRGEIDEDSPLVSSGGRRLVPDESRYGSGALLELRISIVHWSSKIPSSRSPHECTNTVGPPSPTSIYRFGPCGHPGSARSDPLPGSSLGGLSCRWRFARGGREVPKGAGPVADRVLLIRGELPKRPSQPPVVEHRIVAETALFAAVAQDEPLGRCAKDARLRPPRP